MQGNLIITIPEDSTDVGLTIEKENGCLEQKTVSINDVITNLVSSYKFSTGLLPKGTRYFSGSLKSYFIIIETAARKRLFKDEINLTQIPFPNCFFGFCVNNKVLQETILFSRSHSISFDDDQLYNFPFGNVYESGSVCWGNINLPEINNPINLNQVVNLFFASTFNNDLFSINSNINKIPTEEASVYNLKDLIKYLSTKDIFPPNVLKESGITLKQFIQKGENRC